MHDGERMLTSSHGNAHLDTGSSPMVPNSLIMVSWVAVVSLMLSTVALCRNSITPWGLLLAAMVIVAMVLVLLSNA